MQTKIAKDSRHNLATAAAAVTAVTAVSAAPADASVDKLVADIRSKDDAVRGDAWQGAAPYGAKAVNSLADVMYDPDFEVARSARRAIWKIVRHAGRPGAREEARAVEAELIPLLTSEVEAIQREVLWMLSEIGRNRSIRPIVKLLTNPALRDDARMALQRIPGQRSLDALKAALTTVPEDFRYNIAEALRKRGVAITEYPSQKLVPKKA